MVVWLVGVWYDDMVVWLGEIWYGDIAVWFGEGWYVDMVVWLGEVWRGMVWWYSSMVRWGTMLRPGTPGTKKQAPATLPHTFSPALPHTCHVSSFLLFDNLFLFSPYWGSGERALIPPRITLGLVLVGKAPARALSQGWKSGAKMWSFLFCRDIWQWIRVKICEGSSCFGYMCIVHCKYSGWTSKWACRAREAC